MMVLNRINRIPLVREGKPAGIVTREDILRALVQSQRADTASRA